MTTALTFNDFTFTPVSHQNSLWIRAAELARALGYSSEEKVSRVYRRNEDEFTPDMTQVIEITDRPELGTSKNLINKARIFSLRGCHLLAMFARTPVAKAFRRWVLDVLDRLAAEERAALPEVPHIAITPSTTASRKPLEKLVKVWARQSGLIVGDCWTMLNAAFNFQSITELPEEWIPDAIAWVQGKIDNLTPALPVSAPLRTPLLSLSPDDLAALDRAAQRVEELNRHVMKEIGELHVEILERVDLRRVQFPAWEVLSEFIFYSLFRAAELPSGSLEREKNPALALKMLAGALGNR